MPILQSVIEEQQGLIREIDISFDLSTAIPVSRFDKPNLYKSKGPLPKIDASYQGTIYVNHSPKAKRKSKGLRIYSKRFAEKDITRVELLLSRDSRKEIPTNLLSDDLARLNCLLASYPNLANFIQSVS